MITIAINVILYNTLGNIKVTGEEQQTNTFVCLLQKTGQYQTCFIIWTAEELHCPQHFTFSLLNAWLSQSYERQLGCCHLATITGFRSKALWNRQYLTTKHYHYSIPRTTHFCLKKGRLGHRKAIKVPFKNVHIPFFKLLEELYLPPISHHPITHTDEFLKKCLRQEGYR